MDIESLRQYCLKKKGVEETLPFGPDTLVYKVGGKIFAITGLDAEECSVNLKCDPEKAMALREEYPDDIHPGFHMNKKHWNTVHFERGLPDKFLIELLDHSYSIVLSSLPVRVKQSLQ